nr:hypothetical protein CFP56_07192 [Quercus suber]
MSSYYAVTKALEEPKVADVSIAPTPIEATTFFTHFKQVERNDLNLVDFWGTEPPYVDFHGYRVPQDCLEHPQAIHRDHEDFM